MADGKVVISTALDNSGLVKGLKAVKGMVGGLTTVVATTATAITAAFATASIAITKQAVDAYADYEQLAGGVETLFKDSADKVKAYAEDAFYTVGLSANEYMQTVTSFSASLISSLGGDTEKAADIANMALVDMADNANKMGTAMESVQTAYQGFAKGQYQLLDNLKLGYGGTKTEMERLLKDAQAITGVKYDINNLADVYNAIHAVQEKLGIAGTTAKEAEKTITGSANMTKAAWKNVLAAIAGGGDLDKAINNLVYSVSKYFDNLVPVVERSLAGIGQLIEQVAPSLVQTVAASLIRAIPSLLSAVYQMVIGLAQGVYQGIVDLFSGSTRGVVAQLNSTDNLADNYNAAADGASNLAANTEKAEKAAKKYLAGFDEITKIGEDKEEALPTVGGLSVGVTPGEIDAVAKETSKLTKPIGILGKILKPLQDISFDNLVGAFDNLTEALEPYKNLALDGLDWLWKEILVPAAEWTIEDFIPEFLDTLAAVLEFLGSILEAVQPTLDWLWEDILKPMAEFVGDSFIGFLGLLKDGFQALSDWASGNKGVVDAVFTMFLGFLAGVWIYNTTKKIIDFAKALGDEFVKLGNKLAEGGLKGAFFAAAIGILAWGIIELAKNWDKMSPAERVITILEALAVAATAAAVAVGVFHTAWSVGLAAAAIAGGLTLLGLTFAFSDTGAAGDAAQESAESFYSSYDWNRTLTLPALAKGAVLPPNKPFLAMVGDQTHGTNVEAPLATIQEAVAIVMEDVVQSNVAGFEATIVVLREILEAVLGIEIGDDVIGRAAARYNNRLAIRNGGVRT